MLIWEAIGEALQTDAVEVVEWLRHGEEVPFFCKLSLLKVENIWQKS